VVVAAEEEQVVVMLMSSAVATEKGNAAQAAYAPARDHLEAPRRRTPRDGRPGRGSYQWAEEVHQTWSPGVIAMVI
jgi:hypothetical protein